MDNDSDDPPRSSTWNSHTAVFLFVWLTALFVFIFLPCFVNKKLRRVCCKRIKERRWNVDVADPSLDDEGWYIIARARYEAARLRAAELEGRIITEIPHLSKAELEGIRQGFLVERLSKYSSTLEDDDFTKKHEEKGESSKVDNNAFQAGEVDLELGSVLENGESSENDVGEALVALPTLALQVHDFDESDTVVTIPSGGVCFAEAEDKREVLNGCVICLSSFSAGEVITWAANDKCAHAFHNECILNWLLAVGRKKRRNSDVAEDEETEEDAVREALDFPMLCPCCRQPFVITPPFDKFNTTLGDTEEDRIGGAGGELSLTDETGDSHDMSVSATE